VTAAVLILWPLGFIIVLAVIVLADLVFFLTGRRK
jgi:hypothetical protein